MSLSKPAKRKHLHSRNYSFAGYEREDGLFDIEGHMTDCKTYSFDSTYRGHVAAGEPIHDMWIRMTINDSMEVVDVEAKTVQGPHAICPAINEQYKAIIGTRLVAGWNHQVRKAVSGVHGCTHLTDMLRNMGTVAYQTMWPTLHRKAAEKRQDNPEAKKSKPILLNTCHAYASDSEIVKRDWPEFYTGDEATSE